jgi:hypothetical protein
MLAGAAVTAAMLAAIVVAMHEARARIVQALGPRATVGSISLRYPVVALRDVRIAGDPAPGAWPSPDEFRAREVRVRITAASLWAMHRGEPLRVDEVAVDDGMLIVLHGRGRWTLLPALRSQAAAPAPASAPAATHAFVVDAVRAQGLVVDYYDGSHAGPLRHLRFEDVRGEVDALALPALERPMRVDLQGRIPDAPETGGARDASAAPAAGGTVTLSGTLAPAAYDAAVDLRAHGIALAGLRPWVEPFTHRPARAGRMDLDLDIRVADRRLHAPGHLVVTGLAFDERPAPLAGLGHRALLAALTKDDRLDLRFTLQGRTDDPAFSPDEAIARRAAAGLGAAVGSGIRDVIGHLAGARPG